MSRRVKAGIVFLAVGILLLSAIAGIPSTATGGMIA